MTKLVFRGPAHYLKPEGPDGPTVSRGEEFETDREEEFLTNPHIDCEKVSGDDGSRRQEVFASPEVPKESPESESTETEE